MYGCFIHAEALEWTNSCIWWRLMHAVLKRSSTDLTETFYFCLNFRKFQDRGNCWSSCYADKKTFVKMEYNYKARSINFQHVTTVWSWPRKSEIMQINESPSLCITKEKQASELKYSSSCVRQQLKSGISCSEDEDSAERMKHDVKAQTRGFVSCHD